MEILGFDLGAIDVARLWRGARDFVAPRLLPTVGVVLLAAIVFYVARWSLGKIETRLARRTSTQLDDHLVRLVRRTLQLSALAWAVWRVLGLWSAPRAAAVVEALWLGALAIPLASFIGDLLEVVEHRVVHHTETTLDDTALPLLNRIVRFGIVAVGGIFALDRLGLNVAPLLAGAGVLGLALSLAAKDTLSNLIAGVLLILDRPFQVGDRIELWSAPNETGTWGDVIEIGLRATKICNPDNLVIVVPNNEIMRRDIVNYTASGDHMRLRIPFAVEYESDLEAAKRAIREVAAATAGVKPEPPPVVIVRGFGPSEVNLELRVWIEQARERRAIADHITERVMGAFAEGGIRIPYPRREIYVREMEPAPGRIAGAPRAPDGAPGRPE